jgi:hypothetical protein
MKCVGVSKVALTFVAHARPGITPVVNGVSYMAGDEVTIAVATEK